MVPHMTHDAVLLVSAVVHPEVLKLYNEIRPDEKSSNAMMMSCKDHTNSGGGLLGVG
jgi:hypothetical protein